MTLSTVFDRILVRWMPLYCPGRYALPRLNNGTMWWSRQRFGHSPSANILRAIIATGRHRTSANLFKNLALKVSGPVAWSSRSFFKRRLTFLDLIANHAGMASGTGEKKCSCFSSGSLHLSSQVSTKASALFLGVLHKFPCLFLIGGKKGGDACLCISCLFKLHQRFVHLGKFSIVVFNFAK